MTALGPNPSGFCMCGCGEKTPIARASNRNRQRVKGTPMRFCLSHHPSAKLDPREHLRRYHVDSHGCWIWGGQIDRKGYGRLAIETKPFLAHRWFYTELKGPIPAGLQVDHLCRVRSCVNPDHLEPVLGPINVRRSSLAKLTIEQARQIRDADGLQREIAARYGVSRSTVSLIRSGRIWREVEVESRGRS